MLHEDLVFPAAEKFLESVEGNQNYPILLLTTLEKSQDDVIRVCAAVTFKNYIKRNWRIVSPRSCGSEILLVERIEYAYKLWVCLEHSSCMFVFFLFFLD